MVNLTPTDLTLIAAAVNEKIAWLDSEYARLRSEDDETIGWIGRDLETNRVMRMNYVAIIRRIEQALDVPFADDGLAQEAVTA